jgi:hypothetical protein
MTLLNVTPDLAHAQTASLSDFGHFEQVLSSGGFTGCHRAAPDRLRRRVVSAPLKVILTADERCEFGCEKIVDRIGCELGIKPEPETPAVPDESQYEKSSRNRIVKFSAVDLSGRRAR